MNNKIEKFILVFNNYYVKFEFENYLFIFNDEFDIFRKLPIMLMTIETRYI